MRVVWFLIFAVALQSQNPFDRSRLSALKEQGSLEEALALIRSSRSINAPELTREEYRLLFQLGRYQEAQETAERWIRLAEEAGGGEELLDALVETAKSFRLLDNRESEVLLLRRAAELAAGLSRADQQIECLLRLVTLEASMGNYTSAVALLDQADEIWEEEKDGVLEGRLTGARASLLLFQGRWQEALREGEKALRLAQREGMEELETTTLINLAQAHIRLHQYAEALRMSHRVLDLVDDVRNRSIALATIGICHFELNQVHSAATAFEEVLELARKSGNRNFEAWALGELGITVWKSDRDVERSLQYLEESLDLYERTGDRLNYLVFLENKAMVYRDLGRFQEALALYREVQARTRQMPGRGLPANVLKSIGQCLSGLGRFEEAERTLEQAVRVAEATGDIQRVWQSNRELATLYRNTSRPGKATEAYESALKSIESVREALQLEALKTDFFTDKVRVYEEYADFLLNSSGEDGPRRSLEVAERARARSLLDALAESRARLHEALPVALLEQERSLLEAISALQGRIREGDFSERVQNELSTLQEELQEFYLQVRAEHPAFSELRYPRPSEPAAIQGALLPDELLLVYQLGEASSYLWVVDSTEIRCRKLPARAEVEAAVQKALAELMLLEPSPPSLTKLADALLPEEALAGPRSLIVVPAGILFYLPIDILPTKPNGSPLAGSHRTVYLPSASLLVEMRSKPERIKETRLLALGDAEYEGAETTERVGTLIDAGRLGPLPHTRAEVASVRGLFGRMSTTTLLGPEATEAELKSKELSRYSILHLAAHGVIDARMPSRSALILGRSPGSEEDGILQVHEVLRLPLNASLVTLSACQSALGKMVTGEGMVGLTRAFLYAGADTVMATLWNVNDAASAQFMAGFYRSLREGYSKAEALRRAKMLLRQDPRYDHPYFWAPYILIGEGFDPVEFPSNRTFWWSTSSVAVLLGMLLWWLHRRPSFK